MPLLGEIARFFGRRRVTLMLSMDKVNGPGNQGSYFTQTAVCRREMGVSSCIPKPGNGIFEKSEFDKMKKYGKANLNRITGFLVFLLIILGATPWARCEGSSTEEKIEVLDSAIIKDKGDYGILIDGRKYRMTDSTVIFDLLGKEIPLCDLPVPCEARVEYQAPKGLPPVCLRIEMRRLLEDSKDKE